MAKEAVAFARACVHARPVAAHDVATIGCLLAMPMLFLGFAAIIDFTS